MPAVIPKSSRIDVALLEKLDKFMKENYIPPESIPTNAIYLPDLQGVGIYHPKKIKDKVTE